MRAIAVICIVMVSAALAGADQRKVATVWDASGAATVLPTPDGYESEANGINSAGHIVGLMRGPVDGANLQQAVLWMNNNGTYTRHVLPGLPGAVENRAFDINDSNWIVGETYMSMGTAGFYYVPSPSVTTGTTHEIPNPGTATYPLLYPRRISETGWVAGTFAPRDMPGSTMGEFHGFRYDAANQTSFNDVGILDDGYRSYGRDVDNIGRTVGNNVAPDGGFYYDSGVLSEIPGLLYARGITDSGAYVLGDGWDGQTGDIRIVKLEGAGAGTEILDMSTAGDSTGAIDINNQLDVCGRAGFNGAWRATWYEYAIGQWHELNGLTGDYAVATAISDTQLMAGWIRYDTAVGLPLAKGSGKIRLKPTGFVDAQFTTTGMPAGSEALDTTVELENLSFVSDDNGKGMVTLAVSYDEAEVLAREIEESTLRLYWFDDTADEWILAGRSSNNDQSTGAFVAGEPTNMLGDWGVDVAGNQVWANIDHASTYAIAGIPEPTTSVLLGLGAMTLLRRRAGRNG